jgi:uncharacterized protein YecE (DUF72 family)
VESLSISQRQARADSFLFRGFQPHVKFGTASDRYAGWIGQIYPESYSTRVTSRRRKLGKKTYEERTVPVDSAADYFEHFDVLEIDFTFYRALLDADGKTTSNYGALERYAECAPAHARFYLKAPQACFARRIRRSVDGKATYLRNPDFLNANAYERTFLHPALEILGDRIKGVIFEQEYQRVSDSPDPDENVREFDAFFRSIPSLVQSHLEIRSSHLLHPPYFDWLADMGLGFVFSHWTWLPPLRAQWKLGGERFTAADRNAVTRLLTPLDMPYAQAYGKTHPFDAVVPEIANSEQAQRMILDTTALAFQAESHDAVLNVIANNRAWGNAPALARAVANRILEEEERRSVSGDQSRP